MAGRKGSKAPDFGYSVSPANLAAYKKAVTSYNRRITAATKKLPADLAGHMPKKLTLMQLAKKAKSESQLGLEIEQLNLYKGKGLKFEVREAQLKTKAEWTQIDKAIEEENKRREAREGGSKEKQAARNMFRTQKMRDEEPIDLKRFLAEKPERQQQLIEGGYSFNWIDPRLVEFQQRWIQVVSMNSSVAMMRWPEIANVLGNAWLNVLRLANSMDPEEFYKRYKAFPEMDFSTVSDPQELLQFIEGLESLLS